MKLLIVRHGDPDYTIDSLTEKGRREAEFLADRLCKLDVKDFYVSTMGRARDTAAPTLTRLGRTAERCDWLREFDVYIRRPDIPDEPRVCWDWLPQDWTADPRFYTMEHWHEHPAMVGVRERYEWVTGCLDALLERHGYKRENNLYRAVRRNNDTVVLFCHFGVECVLLSHLLGIPPMLLWHGFCAAPTSVTTAVTEERREGFAYFRVSAFGDISHLYANGEPPAFSARFRECSTNADERVD